VGDLRVRLNVVFGVSRYLLTFCNNRQMSVAMSVPADCISVQALLP
jgi:hypothetical protein